MGISIVINTYNAEKFLDRVLSAVKNFDEILICDMYSEDNTLEIAEKHGAKIIFHPKINYVEPARNFAIQQAKNDWVLLLDADEVVTPTLKKYLVDFKNNPKDCVALAMPRKNYFLGKWMRSAYPDFVYRFFKKDSIYWPETIHSKPDIKGKVHYIPKSQKTLVLEHLANDSVADILRKNNIYSDAEVEKRKSKKVGWGKLLFSPLMWFFKYYFIKKGFLDGKEGFIFSCLKAQYKFSTLAKLIENQNKK